jgi:hypothetical protein
MKTLETFTQYEISIFLAALAAIVAYQLITGQIKTAGLISDKSQGGNGSVSPARVQLLLLTLGFGFYLLAQLMEHRAFPTIDMTWILILGGSHSVFLGSKSLQMFTSQIKGKEGD